MGRPTTTVCFQTVGCRLNQYETERMAADLTAAGLVRVDPGEVSDLYIINTCTVTHRAAKDSRYFVRKARRQNPDARIVLVGCYVETDRESIAALDGVDAIIGNDEKERIVPLLRRRLPELAEVIGDPPGAVALTDFRNRNRAWIKISDGCNQTCSYCQVTIVRGNLRCRPTGEIVDEVNGLVEHGYHEVVLTGVNIGYYQDPDAHPPVADFTGLCRALLEQTDIHRVRLSSIEPQTVTDDLLALFAASDGRICRHWHVPLQSGSDRILKAMKRPYTAERFLQRLQRIHDARPGTLVGADVIVGFPGETEDDFAHSCQVAESGLLDYLHVFSYSDRPGTAAAELPDKVRPQAIKERVTHLRAISDRLWHRACRRCQGDALEVICEHRQDADGRYLGVADNYLRLRMPPATEGGRGLYRVVMTELHDDFADCRLAD